MSVPVWVTGRPISAGDTSVPDGDGETSGELVARPAEALGRGVWGAGVGPVSGGVGLA